MSSVRAHHLSSKYASFRYNMYQVLNTDTDESWHTLCVRLSNVCFLPLHTPKSLHSRDQCPNARSLLCRFFFIQCFFFAIFLDWMRPSNLYSTVGGYLVLIWSPPRLLYTTINFWFGLEHPSDAKISVISQMSLSQNYTWYVHCIVSVRWWIISILRWCGRWCWPHILFSDTTLLLVCLATNLVAFRHHGALIIRM